MLAFAACKTEPDLEYWNITWDLNYGAAGAGAYTTQIVKGAVLARPSPDPTKADYTFGGWYTDIGLTQAYNFANPVTANLSLYAKWETSGASMAGAIPLTENVWADGNLPTYNDKQWFIFTATAATQWIHFIPGTLNYYYGIDVQIYDSGGTEAESEANLSSQSTGSTSRSLTPGETYYIRVRPSNNGNGTYWIGFTASTAAPFPPPNIIPLTENVWADGSISTAYRQQWFSFTATASEQYLHAFLGTGDSQYGIYVQVYDSGGAEAESETHWSSEPDKYTLLSLTEGETYYIRVRPYISGGFISAYRIGFNTTFVPPPGAIPLTENQWADVSLLATYFDSQWFSFTATESAQYLHADYGALNSSSDISAQVYDSGGAQVGNSTLSRFTGASRSLTAGETYYIRVWTNDSAGGPYRIAFNASFVPPGITPIPLIEDQWAGGSLPTSNDVQWFTFTATASTQWGQYIHVDFGTLTGLYAQVCSSGYYVSGNEMEFYGNNKSASRSLNTGQTYYIIARPYSSDGSGTYKIAFNTSSTAPIEVQLPPDAAGLAENVWANGNLPTGSSVQWFSFTATASTQWIHFESGTLSALYVQVYDSRNTDVGDSAILSSRTYTPRSLSVGQTYYIRVMPYGSNGGGTYRIGFNASIAPPPGATGLAANQWADGNLPTSSDVQWFTFDATALTQWIHVEFDTLDSSNGISMQVYTSGGAEVGGETRLSSSTTANTSQTLTSGQTYYIRVRPYNSSYSGTYRILFNATPYLPDTAFTVLTFDTWASGSFPMPGPDGQWYTFTATASMQWLHFEPGAQNLRIYVNVYNSAGAEVGSGTPLDSGSSSYTSRTLTPGQTYYIRAMPGYNSVGAGTYRILFNATPYLSSTTIIPLALDTWANGNLPTRNDEQWFSLTATASTQWIHIEYGTIPSSLGIYVNVFNSAGAEVGTGTRFDSNTDYKYTSRSLTPGQTYYIRVTPASASGTYQILFCAAPYLPGTAILSIPAGYWQNGNLPTQSGEQWFTFTANASTQWIHVRFGTLDRSYGVYVQVYGSAGATSGFATRLRSTTTNNTSSTSRSLTPGQTYYIRVWPYNSYGLGTYEIGFNTYSYD